MRLTYDDLVTATIASGVEPDDIGDLIIQTNGGFEWRVTEIEVRWDGVVLKTEQLP